MPYILVLLAAIVGMLLVLVRTRRRMQAQVAALEQTRRLLEESRDRLELALEGADEALWDWDVLQHRTHYSERWSEMLGYSPSEIGSNVEIWEQLVHPDDREATVKKLTAHLAGETPSYQAEFRMKTKDGDWRWIQARGRVVGRTPSGAPARMAGTHIDVTEHKNLTAALAEARDAALAASRSKSAFLANMSHEIRTPMNGIVGIAELQVQSARDEVQRALAGTVLSSSRALLVILNDILDFSKIEAGEMRLERVPFHPAAVLDEALRLFRPEIERKDLYLRADISSELPATVTGDPGRWRQVMLNLLGNALKFTQTGGLSIRCHPLRRDDEQVEILVEIADTGPGIAEPAMQRLFKPFVQGDDSATRRHGGTGLGLAISKQLVEMMGGSIEVSSEPGRGATFRFTATFEAGGEIAWEPEERKKPTPIRGGAHILVAEDNLLNQMVARHMLEYLGHSLDVVSNGREALEAMAQRRYDLVLMDWQMPEMSGLEAVQQLRERNETRAEPPVIAVTASVMSSDREACLSAGMDDFISKPITLEALAAVIDKWVPGQRQE